MKKPADIVVLIPTPLEREGLNRNSAFSQRFDSHIVGFGPIASAAVCSQLIAALQPQQLLLIGIAGSYDERLEIGTATSFDRVACWGVGAGCETDLQLPSQMNLPLLGSGRFDAGRFGAVPIDEPGIFEQLNIRPATREYDDRLLVTVPAAAGNVEQVTLRRERFPNAIAEDMEGFGVALASRLYSVPLTIIRGISNRAGNRDNRQWKTQRALDAAAALALDVFGG